MIKDIAKDVLSTKDIFKKAESVVVHFILLYSLNQ